MASRTRRTLLVGLLAMLTGCSGVPGSGRVVEEEPLSVAAGDSAVDEIRVQRIPSRPQPGAAPAEIVRGFLDAQSSARDDHGVARQFLAANVPWNDDSGVLLVASRDIDDTASVRGTRATLGVRVRRTATISPAGDHVVAPADISETYHLEQVAGQWRLIAPVPAGLRLLSGDLRAGYQRASLFYLDSDRVRLVPDPVFLPNSSSAAFASNLVRRLLLPGPTAALGDGVRTAVPAETKLLGSGVALDERVATVNLSLEAERASGAARHALVAQIVWTLTQPSLGIDAVRVRVEGRPFELGLPGGGDAAHTRSDWRQFDPAGAVTELRPFLVRGRDVWLVDEAGRAARVLGPGIPAAQALDRAVVSPDGRYLAVVARTAQGQSLYLGAVNGALRLVDSYAAIAGPSWGSSSRRVVWMGERPGSAAQLFSAPSGQDDAQATPLAAAPLPGRVRELKVGVDGTRVAAVVETAAGRHVFVGRFTVSAGASAVRDWRSIAPTLGAAGALTWTSPLRLAFVARGPVVAGAPPAPAIWQIDADGYDRQQTNLAGPLTTPPSSLSAAPDLPMLASLRGAIYRQSPTGEWQLLTQGTAAAYAG